MLQQQPVDQGTLQLKDLPRDIISLIFSFLDKKTLLQFRLVNRSSELITRQLFLKMAESRITQIIGGGFCSYLVKADGSLYSWGMGSYELQQFNNGYDCTIPKLSISPNLINVLSISGGHGHAIAVRKDGTLYAWGDNTYGQLGLGHFTKSLMPQVVPEMANIAKVSANYGNVLAVSKEGILYAWGFGSYQGRAWGITDESPIPQIVPELTNVLSVSGGLDHNLALTKDGKVYAWGKNTVGQLGIGVAYNNTCYLPQMLELSNVVEIASGRYHNLALTKDGIVYAWGRNVFGELGLGCDNNCNSPQQVPIMERIVHIAAGSEHSLALTDKGRIYAWGYNINAQLGLGHKRNCNLPQKIHTIKEELTNIAGGFDHSLAVTKDNKLYAWGYNVHGQLGLAKYEDFSWVETPEQVPDRKMLMIKNSIRWRENKRQLECLTPGTLQALLRQLDIFLFTYGKSNFVSVAQPMKFFVRQREINLANGLKNYLRLGKNDVNSVRERIEIYNLINDENEDQYNEAFAVCLNTMNEILNKAQEQCEKSIEKELSPW